MLISDATQKEIGVDLEMSSGTLSRRMKELEKLGLVDRDRSHGPYRILFPRQVLQVLQAGADLSRDVAAERAAAAADHALQLRKRGMRARTISIADEQGG